MAKLIEIKCPKCSAPLTIDDGATSVTCRYCGGTSVVERGGTRAPGYGPRAGQAAPHAAAAGARTAVVMGVVTSLGGVGMAMFLSFRATEHAGAIASGSGSPGSAAAAAVAAIAPAEQIRFDDQPMLADVNGDGVVDIIGTNWAINQPHWISAFDGRDGAQLWRSEPLTKDAQDGSARRAVVHGVVLSVDALGKAQAYDLKTGRPQWSALLGEKPDRVCAGADLIVVETTDDVRHGLEPASGKKRDPGKGPCAPVWGARSDENPAYKLIDWPDFEEHGLPRLNGTEGISAHQALIPAGDGPRFQLGARDKGTSVARVAAFEKRKKLWMEDVPGVDPLTTKVNVTTQLAGYAAGRLVVPYDLNESNGTRMACLDGMTGKRLWDVEIHKSNQVSSGMAISEADVFYATWDTLYVVSLETGELRFKIGPG